MFEPPRTTIEIPLELTSYLEYNVLALSDSCSQEPMLAVEILIHATGAVRDQREKLQRPPYSTPSNARTQFVPKRHFSVCNYASLLSITIST
jgi:hypothetical protein